MKRFRKIHLPWAVALCLAVQGGAAAAQTAELGKADRKALDEIAAAADAGNCDVVVKRGQSLADRRRQALSAELQVLLLDAIALCHIEAKRTDEAYRAALRGTAFVESSPRLWFVRLYAELEKKRWADVATTVEAMAQGHGATLNDLEPSMMWEVLRTMKEEGGAEPRTRILRVLASDSYAPTEDFGTNDAFRLMYAQDRIAAGDKAAAGPAIARLDDPYSLAQASLDPRLRGFLTSADAGAAAARMLARHQDWIGRQPDRLKPVIAAAADLRQLGRAKEALDLLKSAEPRIAKLKAEEDADQINWWWNDLARTYEMLRRPDEAIEAYRAGMKIGEEGASNVSQLINLTLAQNRFGRPKDALQTLATTPLSDLKASPYGIMLYRKARACALHLDGRAAEAAGDLDHIKSHQKDAPGAVSDVHLCMGDLDAAAAAVIRQLDDPEQRPQILLQLSTLELAPPPLPTDAIARNLEALKKRADVRAAIERAGGARSFNVAEIR